MCREEGKALEQLAARAPPDNLKGFGIFGVVKETGVDDEGLWVFREGSFPRDLYRDGNLAFYNALGGRKIALTTWNPYKLVRGFMNIRSRLKEKDLEGNMKGEGLVQGGVIIFGKDGKAKYAYEEVTGSELPVDDISAAIRAVREEK